MAPARERPSEIRDRMEFREKVLVKLGNLETKLDGYAAIQGQHTQKLEGLEETINKAKGGWVLLTGIPAAISFLVAYLTEKMKRL